MGKEFMVERSARTIPKPPSKKEKLKKKKVKLAEAFKSTPSQRIFSAFKRIICYLIFSSSKNDHKDLSI